MTKYEYTTYLFKGIAVLEDHVQAMSTRPFPYSRWHIANTERMIEFSREELMDALVSDEEDWTERYKRFAAGSMEHLTSGPKPTAEDM